MIPELEGRVSQGVTNAEGAQGRPDGAHDGVQWGILDNKPRDHQFIAWLDQTPRRDVGQPGGRSGAQVVGVDYTGAGAISKAPNGCRVISWGEFRDDGGLQVIAWCQPAAVDFR